VLLARFGFVRKVRRAVWMRFIFFLVPLEPTPGAPLPPTTGPNLLFPRTTSSFRTAMVGSAFNSPTALSPSRGVGHLAL